MAIKIKSAKQIEGIRKSAQLAAQVLKHLEQYVKPGVSTQFLNDQALDFITKHGAKAATLGYKGFTGAICASPNEVICHGVPSEEVILKEGDILNIDVTTILNGYFGDTCKMYPVGKISEEAQRLIDVTRNCLKIGVEQCYPGNRFGNIGHYIAEYAHGEGYSVVWAILWPWRRAQVP